MRDSPDKPNRQDSPVGCRGKVQEKKGGDMRRLTVITMAVAVLLFAMNAHAAVLDATPGAITESLQPGQSVKKDITIRLQQAAGQYNLSLGFDPGWGSLSDVQGTIDSSAPFRTSLSITVPHDAAPGTQLIGDITISASNSREAVSTTVPVTVNVPGVGCTTAPSFAGTRIGPDTVWAPNNKPFTVTVSGTVQTASDSVLCAVDSAWYVLEDSYAELDGTGAVTVQNDGTFSIDLVVEASREGDDREGRVYTVTLFAQNSAGVGSSGAFYVKVNHDQGNEQQEEELQSATRKLEKARKDKRRDWNEQKRAWWEQKNEWKEKKKALKKAKQDCKENGNDCEEVKRDFEEAKREWKETLRDWQEKRRDWKHRNDD
jgi:hypothetical protein